MSSSSSSTTFKVGLTPEEKRLYSQLFKALDPEGTGIVTGDKARSTFEKSGLPPAILGEIWQMADKNNLGFLTQFGFCYAMRLIGHTQSGQPPSPALAETPGPLPKFAGFMGLSGPQQPLQPQSTNSSLMQSQPSSVVPQNTATFQAQPDSIPPISGDDFAKFSQLFIRTTGSPNNDLSGSSARDIFLKAKLPTATLGQIWNLVDTENLGKLSLNSFVVAMHLIQGSLNGNIKQLPPFLSDTFWQSVNAAAGSTNIPGSRQSSYASVTSQQTVRHSPQSSYSQPKTANDEWVVNATLKQQYDSIFANLDKSNSGRLSPDQVASFLMTSKLNQQDLATVWDLADIQNTGVFTRVEFSIALFLINKKLSGVPLPNIVPDTLLKSVNDLESQQSPQQQQIQQPPQQQQPAPQIQAPPQQQRTPSQPKAAPKSSIDDLADVFGSPSPTPAQPELAAPQSRELQSRTSSSDLTPSNDLPKVRKNLTAGFKPTSSFGQSLMKEVPEKEHNDLLGEDVAREKAQEEPPAHQPVPQQAPAQPPSGGEKVINYDALRSVPPPPSKRNTQVHTPPVYSPPVETPPVQSPPPLSRDISDSSLQSPQHTQQYPSAANNDLLADPTSGQLSQATSDIANISNQVKSLGSQTSTLHDRKGRAEQELTKILSTKKEIESKLKALKTSYENEVKSFQEVENNLTAAKEETEALRSESSIAEAKLNHLSTELNEKQVAMENLQKENAAMKEKLGEANAEITELQKQLESIVKENQSLTNQFSVKKSQVHVSLVKKQELEAQIQETIAANKKLQEDINRQAEEEYKAQADSEGLQKSLAEAKSFTPSKPEPPAPRKSHGAGKVIAAAAAGAGVVAGGVLGAAVAGSKDEDNATISEAAEAEESDSTKEAVQEQVEPVQEQVKGAVKGPAAESSAPIEALVDEVKDKPSADMTGIEAGEQELEAEGLSNEEARKSEPEPDSVKDEVATSATTNSSVGENETPITSPSNSEYQFPQGSMVGMPGVLVGVQRNDSLTSSVQNNAALSVRDDNIDEISDRDTLGQEDVVGQTEESSPEAKEVGKVQPPQKIENQESDGDKPSSGVESFEMVNRDDAGDQETYGDSSFPSSESKNEEERGSSGNVEEEFPPIKELDYDDDSSSDDDFNDAKDDLTKDSIPPVSTREPIEEPAVEKPVDEFDNAFDDLEPAKPEEEAPAKDMFADEFDDLEAAQVEDTNANEFGDNTDDFFNNDFTNSNMPDFDQQPTEKADNDEWEQLFAGFGNSASAQNTPQEVMPGQFPSVDDTTEVSKNQELIQELVGMGFDEQTAADALEKESWDLQAATNRLLDGA